MHLRLQAVQYGDVVVARDERVDQVRADVSGAAGNENVSYAHEVKDRPS